MIPVFIFKSGYCTCGQSLKYDKDLDVKCNSGCSGNTYKYVEYCGGNNLVSVHATGRCKFNIFDITIVTYLLTYESK
jgi:hypothetical protein